VQQGFAVLNEFDSMSDGDNSKAAIERLLGVYGNDLSSEFCQLMCWYKEQTKKCSTEDCSAYVEIAAHNRSFNRIFQ